ncbi:MAG: hypothetical protein M2R45_03120 [Verrucomicrobia subdivision 3 bacterium]|nr:hypothetical protein [Limisphaerales bacterium]MCS1413188.1 hypothetical protein [Limisphaerales bacterium]
MAHKNDKHPLNAPGKFYVDGTCVGYARYRSIVPDIFSRDDGYGMTYMLRQPTTDQENTGSTEETWIWCIGIHRSRRNRSGCAGIRDLKGPGGHWIKIHLDPCSNKSL